ncbi:unnamed protein product [Dovyalis caffra]|uniref:Uncharacterized protein n=1 Tax=Dovyalis caffra TaxID=77055 RepID=A0AAV1R9J1_9ROSI|nr:unnamed protein product [Dovyalis caffra]
MESSENNANHDTSWTAATNWTIAGGSLVNSLTFESSLSLISDDNDNHNHDDNNDHDQFSTVDSKSKSPLILYAPTPDSAPCEITINFAQSHEVRQIYVRSTARVYEIYCAPETQSSSEYLCTVRCGIATRDEEVLCATNIEEAVLAHAKSSVQEPAEEKFRNGSSLSPNEDDWVEVKALDSPLVVNRNSSSSSNSNINSERNLQRDVDLSYFSRTRCGYYLWNSGIEFRDIPCNGSRKDLPALSLHDLYEATAEITDANPSMSLTLRLLSLQNKGYVCVDEVYVFGDLVDISNLDKQMGPKENSAGNSLMAMLVPGFFQLSKTKGIGGGEDRYNIDTKERQKLQEIGSKAAAPVDVEKKIQEEVRLQEAVGPSSKSVQHEIPQQVSITESKPDISRNHFEGVLDHLVSRVNRIEDLFLRFEESMLKPINSIDVRLQRIEQQLDVLTKKTENSALVPCTRISAPDFSCSESETNSFYNNGSRDISYMASEAYKSRSPSPLTSILPDATPVSVNDAKLQPGLVVTAPEFSNYDDEAEDHAVESVKESPKDKQKHSMSIDDALAYALAGFLSSTSMQTQKYSQTLAIKAPDFPSEEENSNEKAAAPIVESELNTDPSICFSESDGTEHIGNSLSSLEDAENVMRSLNDNNSSKMVEAVDEQCQHSEGEEGESQDICVGHAVAPVMHDVTGADSYEMTDDIKEGEVGDGIINIFDLQKTESLKQFSGDQTDDGSVTTQEVAVSNELFAYKEGIEEESKQDILQNIVELSRASSIVDFESPILEVKFVSQEHSGIKSPLEALLAGMPDLEVEVRSAMENNNNGSENGDQYNLISVEDSGTDAHISVDMDYCSLNEPPSSNMEADELHDCYPSSSPEMPAASLI